MISLWILVFCLTLGSWSGSFSKDPRTSLLKPAVKGRVSYIGLSQQRDGVGPEAGGRGTGELPEDPTVIPAICRRKGQPGSGPRLIVEISRTNHRPQLQPPKHTSQPCRVKGRGAGVIDGTHNELLDYEGNVASPTGLGGPAQGACLSFPPFLCFQSNKPGSQCGGRREPALAPGGMMSPLRTCSSHWARCWSLSRPHCHSLPARLSLPLSLTMNLSLPTSVSSVVSFTHTCCTNTHTHTHPMEN